MFVGRGTSLRDYQRLKAALDRLQSTTVSTSIRQPAEGRRHRFSWINEWQERTDRNGKPAGIELIVPDWFYRAVLDDALVLAIDRALAGAFPTGADLRAVLIAAVVARMSTGQTRSFRMITVRLWRKHEPHPRGRRRD